MLVALIPYINHTPDISVAMIMMVSIVLNNGAWESVVPHYKLSVSKNSAIQDLFRGLLKEHFSDQTAVWLCQHRPVP